MRRQPVLFAIALLLAPAMADGDKKEDEKKAEPSRKPRVESPYAAAARAARQRAAGAVITSEDLERLSKQGAGSRTFNHDPGAAVDEDGAGSLDYLEGLQLEEAARATARAEHEAAVGAARRAVQDLERQLLAVKNPFAAQGEVSEEERLARAEDKSVVARVARIERQLAEAREKLAAAERDLALGARAPGEPENEGAPQPAGD